MRRLAILLLALAAVVSVRVDPAGAVEDTASIVAALRDDPLYVDPSFDDVVTPADRRAIRAAIRAQDEPFFVAIVALREGDRFDGDDGAFLTAISARIGDPRAAYVAFSQYSPRTLSEDPDLEERLRMADDVARTTVDVGGPVGDQLVALLDAVRAPDLQQRYDAARAQQDREAAANESRYDDGDGVPAWLAVVLGFVVVAGVGGFLVSRRRIGGAAPGAPPLLPDRVFEYARAARFDDLRERARTEVIALSKTIDEQPTPSGGEALAAYERAVARADAASKLHDRSGNTVELAGVLVLVDGSREALREAADAETGRRHDAARPLCFFDPLHGRAEREVRFGERDVGACGTCAGALAANRDPDVLREDGRPWFERDGALAATGMGQFSDLASRLARGDAP